MASTSSAQLLTIYLLPGPLGIGIKMSTTGECVVSSKAPQSQSPLQVGDILLSLNGISLVDVDGGTDAWCKLFSAFDNVERKVKVQRDTTAVDNKKFIKNEKKVHLLQNDGSDGSAVQGYANKKRKADNNGNNKSNMDVISLLDDTDDEDELVEVGQKKVSSLNVGVPSRSSMSSLDDDVEVMEVSPSSASSWGLNSSSYHCPLVLAAAIQRTIETMKLTIIIKQIILGIMRTRMRNWWLLQVEGRMHWRIFLM